MKSSSKKKPRRLAASINYVIEAMVSDCPHYAGAVGFLTHPDFRRLLSNPACDACAARNPEACLWLCIYPDCYVLGKIRTGFPSLISMANVLFSRMLRGKA